MNKIMTDAIEGTRDVLDHPLTLDAPKAPQLPPPMLQTLAMQMPPPLAGEQPDPDATPPKGLARPSTIFSADEAIVPEDLCVPVLPAVKPAAPRPAAAASAFDSDQFLVTQGPVKKAPPKARGRRFVRFLFVCCVLGALGWAGATYGPDLYDQYVKGNEAGAPPETSAPLAFPTSNGTDAPIRTAEFLLVGLPETPGVTYRVTTDFETAVSQVDLSREHGPDLQILTYGDDALIRRADGGEWYRLDRGQFPLDGRLERSDWVRKLDELLPSYVRDRAEIADSTVSTISGVLTRHLSLTIDPALLDAIPVEPGPAPIGAEPGQILVADGAVDAAAPLVEPLEIGAVAPAAPESSPTVTPPTDAQATGTSEPAGVEIELWIDGTGLVRQVTGAPHLGAETITILSTSADAWIPAYPTADEIAPLTASALLDLGL